MAVPYIFANVSGGSLIPLAELDANFETPITLAGVPLQLGESISGSTLLDVIGAYPDTNPNGFTSNTGTVTSVTGTGTVSGITLSGSVTSSGSLTLSGSLVISPSSFGSQSANTVLASPNGSAGVPSFRAIAPADFGSQSANTFLGSPNGSAGAPSFRAILPADLGSQTANTVLAAPNGSSGAPTFRALVASDIPALDYLTSGGALGTPSSGTLSNCTVDGTNGVGYINVPQNSKSAAYTLVASDAGKHIYHPSADTTARVWTIPANSSVPFPIGTAITFVNDTSAGAITISITSDTLVWSPAGTTGSRTLAANGVATIIKVTSTRWFISGSGLT